MAKINVQSPNIRYTPEAIEADYEYETVKCTKDGKTNTIKVLFYLNQIATCLLIPLI